MLLQQSGVLSKRCFAPGKAKLAATSDARQGCAACWKPNPQVAGCQLAQQNELCVVLEGIASECQGKSQQ